MANNEITVVANYESGFGMELVQVYLKNQNGTIVIDKEQWNEIQAVMAGKRKTAYSEEFDGYNPKTTIAWN